MQDLIPVSFVPLDIAGCHTGRQLSLAYQIFPFGAVIGKAMLNVSIFFGHASFMCEACERFNNPPLVYWGTQLKHLPQCHSTKRRSNVIRAEVLECQAHCGRSEVHGGQEDDGCSGEQGRITLMDTNFCWKSLQRIS